MIAMQSQDGSHFLGLRQGQGGGYEIVYEAARTGKIADRGLGCIQLNDHLYGPRTASARLR